MACEVDTAFCIQAFDTSTEVLNIWVQNAFKTKFLNIGYLYDCFPLIFNLVTGFSSILLLGSALSIVFFAAVLSLNKNKISLFRESSADATSWLRDTFLPILVMVWTFWVGVIYLTFNFTYLSSMSLTAIFLHEWAELSVLLIGILLLINKPLFWADIFRILLIFYSIFFVNLFLFMSTANPFLQGILSILTLVADFGNVIVYSTYLFRNFPTKKRNRRKFSLLLALLINHVFSFYLPLLVCSIPKASAIIYTIFLIITVIFSLASSGYELATYSYQIGDHVIPSIF